MNVFVNTRNIVIYRRPDVENSCINFDAANPRTIIQHLLICIRQNLLLRTNLEFQFGTLALAKECFVLFHQELRAWTNNESDTGAVMHWIMFNMCEGAKLEIVIDGVSMDVIHNDEICQMMHSSISAYAQNKNQQVVWGEERLPPMILTPTTSAFVVRDDSVGISIVTTRTINNCLVHVHADTNPQMLLSELNTLVAEKILFFYGMVFTFNPGSMGILAFVRDHLALSVHENGVDTGESILSFLVRNTSPRGTLQFAYMEGMDAPQDMIDWVESQAHGRVVKWTVDNGEIDD
jgi:hypothetical protein